MGRGPARRSSRSRRPRERAGASCASSPSSLIAPEPAASRAATSTRRRWRRSPTRVASAACSSRCSCGPLAGGTLRADRRRAPLARRAARRASTTSRRSCATRDDAASLELALIENMAREDLNPVEEARACAALVEELGLTREEVGRRVGRSRVAVSNLIRLLDLPDEALELLERGDADRGPRPRAAARRRPRRPPPPRARRGRRAAGRCARPRRAPAPATADGAPASRPRAAPRRRPPGPGGGGRASRRRARRRPRHRRPRHARAATGYRLELAFDDARRGARAGPPARLASPPRAASIDAAPRASARIAARGRLAQSVRALL